MPFGGGGSGSYSLQNHKHTNTLQDGGSLDSTASLIDSVTIASYVQGLIDSTNKVVLLDEYTAASAESTKTFTFSPALDNDTYSKIIIQVMYRGTAAQNLLCVWNGETGANYYGGGQRFTSSTLAYISISAASSLQVASSTILSGANADLDGQIAMQWIRSNLMTVDSKLGKLQTVGTFEQVFGYNDQSNDATLSTLTIKTSTSTWAIGTKFSVYGVLR